MLWACWTVCSVSLRTNSLFLCTPPAPRSAHSAGPDPPWREKCEGFRFLATPMMHFREGFKFLSLPMMHRGSFSEGFRLLATQMMHFRKGFRFLSLLMMHRGSFSEGFRFLTTPMMHFRSYRRRCVAGGIEKVEPSRESVSVALGCQRVQKISE